MASMKMASASSRSWQAIKAHTPLIKFRKGGSTSKGMAGSLEPASQPPLGTSSARPPTPCGIVIEDSELPRRYARKPLSDIEIQFIMRGGPE